MAQITYTNKETLNSQPSIADKNKVKAEDMNEIKSVVNTNYGEVGDITSLTTTDKTSVVNAINELKGGEVYSTSEVKTNKKWIDGKPIYRKTYVFSNLTAPGRTIDITNLNMDTFLPYEAVGTWSNGGAINWPYYISNTDNGRLYRASSTQVNINYALPDYNSRRLIVTLYYTKTTD